MAALGSAQRATLTEWVLPQTFAPDGNTATLELAGLNVDVLSPSTHFLPKQQAPLTIPLHANVTMMCGCPVAPDTDWKPENFKVVALIKRPDGKQDLVNLQFDPNAPDNAPSQFTAEYVATEPGIYQVTVMAHENAFGNSGSDLVTFIVP